MEFRRVLFRSTDQFRPISKYLADRPTIEENVAFELTRCHDRAFFRVSAGNKIDIDFRPRDANRRHVRAPPCGSGRSGFLSLYRYGDSDPCTEIVLADVNTQQLPLQPTALSASSSVRGNGQNKRSEEHTFEL